MGGEEHNFISPKSNKKRPTEHKRRKKNHLLNEKEDIGEERSPVDENPKSNDTSTRKEKKKKHLLLETRKGEDTQEVNREGPDVEEDQPVYKKEVLAETNLGSNGKSSDSRKNRRKKKLLKEAAEADRRGICYLSRIPPHMDHVKLRQILSQFGEILRIYLTPENPGTQVHRKRAGKFQQQVFSEGWVEFKDKRVAKRVASMLNGEQIGGRKRSSFYYDLWNIKYLSKFKWDDLTSEIAYKSAVREQKLALEISAAKKERDFYLSKVDQSRALSSIEERLEKKRKVQEEAGMTSELPVTQQMPKFIRQFPQKQPVVDAAVQSKPGLSKDILAGVFGGS